MLAWRPGPRERPWWHRAVPGGFAEGGGAGVATGEVRATDADDEAEYMLVGLGLSDPALWPTVLSQVRPDDCRTELGVTVLRFAAVQARAGVLVGLAECAGQVPKEHRSHLGELRGAAPSPDRLGYWCGRVRRRAQMRRLGQLGWHMQSEARRASGDPDDIAGRAVRQIAEIAAPGLAEKVLSPDQWLDLWQQEGERRAEAAQRGDLGVPTGLPTVDRDIVVERSHLVLIAAATGVGKTALGISVAAEAAFAGRSVLYLNTEMDATALANRIIASRAGVYLSRMRRGELTADEWEQTRAIDARLRQTQLHLTQPLAGAGLEDLAILARSHQTTHGLDVLVMDYIGRLDLTPRHGEQEWNVLERAAARFKGLATDLDCVVYLLVQRTEEGALAGSKRMRNDADLVLELAQADDKAHKRWAHATHTLTVSKARHARSGQVLGIAFDSATMRWTELGRA